MFIFMVSKDINFKTTYKKLKIRKNAFFHENQQKSTILAKNRDLGPPELEDEFSKWGKMSMIFVFSTQKMSKKVAKTKDLRIKVDLHPPPPISRGGG